MTPQAELPPYADWMLNCIVGVLNAIEHPIDLRGRCRFCVRLRAVRRIRTGSSGPRCAWVWSRGWLPMLEWILSCGIGVLNATGNPLEQGSGCFRSRSSPGSVCRLSAALALSANPPRALLAWDGRDSSVRCLALRGVSAQMGIHSARGSGLGRSRHHGGVVGFRGCGVACRCGAALVLAVR